MIESLLVDELRARVHEDVARGAYKTPPDPAEERAEALLGRVGAPSKDGRQRMGGMSLEHARRIAKDAEDYDASLTRGGKP